MAARRNARDEDVLAIHACTGQHDLRGGRLCVCARTLVPLTCSSMVTQRCVSGFSGYCTTNVPFIPIAACGSQTNS